MSALVDMQRRAHEVAKQEIAMFRTGYETKYPITTAEDRILASHVINAIIPLVLEHAANIGKAHIDRHESAALVNGTAQPAGSQDRACLIFHAGALSGMGRDIAAAIRAGGTYGK